MERTQAMYSIVGELGKGAFGTVYLVEGEDGHKLALKTVNLKKIPEDFRPRAEEEAKILRELNHRHLVHHVNSYIIRSHLLCIVTELCAAGDLESLLGRLGFSEGPPEKLVLCWLMQAASCLNYMHTHTPVVLHRDLKPQNVYIMETGDLRLGDLGLARKLTTPTDYATSMAGTIVYLSPEILTRRPYNSKTDIWSLGCVFYGVTCTRARDEMGLMFLLLQVMGNKDSQTFFDGDRKPEVGEEHFISQIQQLQRDFTAKFGEEVLEAAYGIISNVRDNSALVMELHELLGDSGYEKFAPKVLKLRALEYSLHKITPKDR